MKKHSPALLSMLLLGTLMVLSPVTQADEAQDFNAQEQSLSVQERNLRAQEQIYNDKMKNKALRGFNNINTALLEIPKNIINTTNESNVFYGFTGGLIKGMIHTAGRLAMGVTDLVTFPIITQSTMKPERVWEDFDAETTYGEVLRLDNEPNGFEFVKPK